MQQLADDVWQIPLAPRDGINAYVIGDVLIDAGIEIHANKIIGLLRGRAISANALRPCTPTTRARCGVRDVRHPGLVRRARRRGGGAGRPTSRPACASGSAMARYGGSPRARRRAALREGDAGGGFVVLDTPGHTPATSRSGARATAR